MHYQQAAVAHGSASIGTIRAVGNASPLVLVVEMRYHSPPQPYAKLSTGYPQPP